MSRKRKLNEIDAGDETEKRSLKKRRINDIENISNPDNFSDDSTDSNRSNEEENRPKIDEIESILKFFKTKWIDLLTLSINDQLLPEIIVILSEFYEPPFTVSLFDRVEYNKVLPEIEKTVNINNINIDYTMISCKGFGHMFDEMLIKYPKKCVFLSGSKHQFEQTERFKKFPRKTHKLLWGFHPTYECIMNEDNGNTEFALSVIDEQLGRGEIIFKGLCPLNACGMWEIVGVDSISITKHSGLTIINIFYHPY